MVGPALSQYGDLGLRRSFPRRKNSGHYSASNRLIKDRYLLDEYVSVIVTVRAGARVELEGVKLVLDGG